MQYLKFFLGMLVGLTFWHLVVASFEHPFAGTIGVAIFATLFKWLFDKVTAKGQRENLEST
ncbi:hypothetical protein [Salisediminibacterium halotolerans]|uniref:Uncharacterized protein n=1 Tax=Salisediminibacterium halotolerans TaxID=517425 RepID=A0A1H9SXZ5_9BACI|nr:hypothetical protein [Salisediminibacterium haloalkalitolerans]SER89746.1 hypothetical protein SAMN05444126_10861 [Salisediminibacterium haloalkalitolerans]